MHTGLKIGWAGERGGAACAAAAARLIKLNQIKGPRKATHGPRRRHIPAPPQGGQTLHHKVMQAWGAMSESRQH